MRSPSLTPSLGPTLEAVHLVLCDFGKLGTAYVETEPVMTETMVVENMLAGQYDHPLEVVAFNVAEGWARDVSQDRAALVVEHAVKFPQGDEPEQTDEEMEGQLVTGKGNDQRHRPEHNRAQKTENENCAFGLWFGSGLLDGGGHAVGIIPKDGAPRKKNAQDREA